MLVDVELGQRTDVDFELALHRERAGQPVVESVDSLDDQYVLFSELHVAVLVFPLAGLKIEDRQIDALARKQFIHVVVKQLHIQRFQTFQIEFPVLIARALIPVRIIIIERERMRL